MKHMLTVYCCVTFVFQKNAHVVTIDDYEDVPENDEEAGGRDFQLYSGVSSRDLFCWSVKTSFSLCFELRSGFVCRPCFCGFLFNWFFLCVLTLDWGGTVGLGCIHWRLWH
jgi:hypothetical protein